MKEKIIEILNEKVWKYQGTCSLEELAEEISNLFPQWISVEDRLPEELEWVFVRVEIKDLYGKTNIEFHSGNFKDNEQFTIGHHFAWDIGKVTHWMPIIRFPEPPKQK